MKTRLVPALAVLLGAVESMAAGASQATSLAVIDDPDAYDVFAVALPPRFSSGDDVSDGIALFQETVPREGCLPPSELGWGPVVENYRTANIQPRLLQTRLSLSVPYTFVTSAELRELLVPGRPPSMYLSVFSARFPNGKLIAVSAVGFDVDKTRAFVSVQYNCVPGTEPTRFGCAGGRHVLLEKTDGRWAKGDWTCTWTAD